MTNWRCQCLSLTISDHSSNKYFNWKMQNQQDTQATKNNSNQLNSGLFKNCSREAKRETAECMKTIELTIHTVERPHAPHKKSMVVSPDQHVSTCSEYITLYCKISLVVVLFDRGGLLFWGNRKRQLWLLTTVNYSHDVFVYFCNKCDTIRYWNNSFIHSFVRSFVHSLIRLYLFKKFERTQPSWTIVKQW